MKLPCVYLLASQRNGTLYVGVTSDLVQRIWQHKNDLAEGFTKRYGVHMLVWYEECGTMEAAISREKAIKEWKRAWKIRLIENRNPEWKDIYNELL
jgi:putative endonuclease